MKIVNLIKCAAEQGVFLYVEDAQLRFKSVSVDFPLGLKEEIVSCKHELITFLSNAKEMTSEQGNKEIKYFERLGQTSFKTSFAQQRLWFIDQFQDRDSSNYNMPLVLKIEGMFNVQVAERALCDIIERHEILRTIYTDLSGEPEQVIQTQWTFSLNQHNLGELSEAQQSQEIKQLVENDARQPFDLSSELMLRASWLSLGDTAGILLFNMHHIASDGWSMSILMKEFTSQYKRYSSGQGEVLAPLPIQYVDYALWQRTYLRGEVLEQQLNYWREQLLDLPVLHSLPLDKVRPKQQSFIGGTVQSELGAGETQQLKALCQKEGATLFMGLHAVFSALLARYSNETDIVVGSPVANREQAEVAGLMGFFVNTLVLRSKVSAVAGLVDLIRQSRECCLGAYAHQQVPFEKLVEVLQVERSLSHSPLFQVMLALQNNEEAMLALPGLRLSPMADEGRSAKFDLTLNVMEVDNRLLLSWNYCSDIFSETTIAQMAGHFSRLVSEALQNPTQSIHGLALLSAEELAQLDRWNDTAVDYPKDVCIHQLFEAQAEQTPDAVAVVCGDDSISYGDLNANANQLGHYLRAIHGVTAESLVGICQQRGIALVVSVLAVLKAGGAYVPLDSDYPAERLGYICSDAALGVVLCDCMGASVLKDMPCQLLNVETLDVSAQQRTEPEAQNRSDNAAYVIYTSGSTGQPKGVVVEHAKVLNYLMDIQARYFNELFNAVVSTPLSFDATVTSLFGPWLVGGYCVLQLGNDLDGLVALLQQSWHAMVWKLTPAHLDGLMSVLSETSELSHHFVIGGEQLYTASAARWLEKYFPYAYLSNEYGPTETVVGCSVHSVTQHSLGWLSAAMPIGRAIANVRLYVLNNHFQRVPVGVVGELYIGGAGVARGYLNREELTAERFIESPFADSERLYRTGDIVQFRPSGELEYLGRNDSQLKIRGYRIEPGEVEAAMQEAGVAEAIALGWLDGYGHGHRQLVGYYRSEANLTPAILRQRLSDCLPAHLVPTLLIEVDKFLLSSNGKIDRRALPAPNMSVLQATYEAPETATEQQLAEIWQHLLGVERVGRRDNFFALGGHSLLAMRLVSQIRQQLGVNVALRLLFEQSDLISQAVLLVNAGVDPEVPAIVAIPVQGRLQLSFAQQRLWLLDQIEGGSSHYHMPMVLELSGHLDVEAVRNALQQIVQRHAVLRTTFELDDVGEPCQVVHRSVPMMLNVEDVQGLKGAAQQSAVRELVAAILTQRFDLSRDAMLRVKLIQVADNKHVLVVNIHHIASDGWSMGVLMREFVEFYRARIAGTKPVLADLPVQYVDYALWQRTYLRGEVLEQQLNYWREQLLDLPVLHSLPLDKVRPKQQSFIGGTVQSELGAGETQQLKALCQKEGATLFMGLHAVFSALLARYSNETDIVVGSPVANREQAEVAGLMGFFVNTLVLRSKVSAVAGLVDLIRQSRECCLGAYAHQQVPFEKLVEVLQVERSLSHSPLFQVMLALQNNEEAMLALPGLRLSPMADEGRSAKFDLTLNVMEVDNRLLLSWNYCSDIFSETTIAQMAGHFSRLVSEALQNPTQSIHGLALLSAEELAQLDRWNDTAVDYPKDVCIHQLFEAQAEQTPDAVAVVCGDDSISYGDLNANANQLGHYLRAIHGVTAESLVGICQQRGIALVVSVLAVLKAGGAYVPLDSDYPAERLGYICSDAALGVVLCDCMGASVLKDMPCQLLNVETLDVSAQQRTEPEAQNRSDNAAYVIYTSGSTGQPKGVIGEHHNIVSLIFPGDYAGFGPDTVMLGNATISFDAATFEWWGALLHGGRLIMNQVSADLDAVIDCIHKHQINTALLTSGLFDVFVQQLRQPLSSLRYLLVGGDVVNPQTIAQMQQRHPALQLVNAYGPTENTTISTTSSLKLISDLRSLPIGKPLANRSCYVLNAQQQRVPLGVAGELFVGGAGIARGYLNRPEATAERFIVSPYQPGERLYRTGDIVQLCQNGNLIYLGRNDAQMKLRGYRIEPGEVETCLLSHPEVNNAVVTLWQSSGHEKQLIAYVSSEHLPLGPCQQLKEHVAALLPAYMVPAVILVLPVLPLTVNGKVDRKTLPAFDPTLMQNDYRAPLTGTEQILCDIIRQVLKLARVSATDNFFKLGGSSLTAMRIISQIRLRLGKQMSLKEFFRLGPLDQMAQYLDRLPSTEEPQISAAPELAVYPLSYAQQGVFIEYQLGRGASYNIPTAFKFGQDFSLAVFDEALNLLIRQHASLRTKYTINEGEPVQTVIERPENHQTFAVDIDSAHISIDVWESAVKQDISSRVSEPLDIFSGVMLQSYSYTHNSGDKIVLLNFSHIAVDGWSIGLVVRDLSVFYAMLKSGAVVECQAAGLSYLDYSYWQRKSSAIHKKDSYEFWQLKLESFYDVPPIKTDFDNAVRHYGNVGEIKLFLDESVRNGIAEISKHNNCSEFNVWSAIYSVVTAIHNDRDSVCINIDFANRMNEGTENIVGMFVNQIILAPTLDFSMAFNQVLLSINKDFSDAIHHSNVQFKEILNNIDRAPKDFGNQLMSNKFSYQDFSTEYYSVENSEIIFSEFDTDYSALKYDLSLVIHPGDGGVFVRWTYNKLSFKNTSVLKLNELFVLIVNHILENSSVPLINIKRKWNDKILQDNNNKMGKFKFKKKVKKYEV